MLFRYQRDMGRTERHVPQLNNSFKMFMLPDGLHKATGKTLEGPAATKAPHSLKVGSGKA